jgi:hypothetical protein
MFRRNTRYDVPIEPKAFTLAGLGMPVGTPVVDVRIHQRIGYWNAKNLSVNLPRDTPRRSAGEASVMENNPESLANAKTDGSFVDEGKIIMHRAETVLGVCVLIFITAVVIRRLKLIQK